MRITNRMSWIQYETTQHAALVYVWWHYTRCIAIVRMPDILQTKHEGGVYGTCCEKWRKIIIGKILREKDTWKIWVRIEGKYYATKWILENHDTMKNIAFIWSAVIKFRVPHKADNFLASRRTISFWKITTQHRV